jgi:hypothetical protein
MKLPIQAPAVVRDTRPWQVSHAAQGEDGLQPSHLKSCTGTDKTCYDSNGYDFCCTKDQCCGGSMDQCL